MILDETCKNIVKLFTADAVILNPRDPSTVAIDEAVPQKQNSEGCGDYPTRSVTSTYDVSASVRGVEIGMALVKRRGLVDEGIYRMKAFDLLGEELCFRIAFVSKHGEIIRNKDNKDNKYIIKI